MKFRSLITILTFLLWINASLAQNVCVYLFYGATCPHCKQEREFLSEIVKKYPIELYEFEVYFNQTNQKLWEEISNKYNTKPLAVPMTFIGSKAFIGFAYGSGEIFDNNYNAWVGYSDEIEKVIKEYVDKGGVSCPISGNFVDINPRNSNYNMLTVTIIIAITFLLFFVFLKKYKVKLKVAMLIFFSIFFLKATMAQTQNELPIPILGLILGLMDGIFNPCALSVLLFLVAYLLSLNLRKRMLIIGTIFSLMIFAIYFSFMYGLFTIFHILPYLDLIKKIVIVMLIIFGLLEIKDFFFYGKFVSLEIPPFAKKPIEKLIKAATIPSAFILGALVSLVEIPCAGAFPIAYTTILASKGIKGIMSLIYIVWYNVFFVLPLMLLTLIFYFGFAKVEKAEKKRLEIRKYMRLAAGIIMISMAFAMWIGWL